MTLTPNQGRVLASATDAPAKRRIDMPNGVYRSLVIRGLLTPEQYGYAITAEGRDALTSARLIRRRVA